MNAECSYPDMAPLALPGIPLRTPQHHLSQSGTTGISTRRPSLKSSPWASFQRGDLGEVLSLLSACFLSHEIEILHAPARNANGGTLRVPLKPGR